MQNVPIPSVPILSPDEARALEKGLFGGDERREWKAMLQAARGVASGVLRDFAEIGEFPPDGRLLVLAGKGNNAGDALLAAREVLARHPGASADVLFAFGTRSLGPLAAKAWRGLSEAARGRVRTAAPGSLSGEYSVCLDGIFGFQYRPPLPREAAAAIEAAAGASIGLRAAVDLPTGWDEPGAFQADFTYATGSAKAPLLGSAHAGRPRFIDLGFFPSGGSHPDTGDRVLLPSILSPLAGLRPASSDKRSQGHLLIVAGTGFPGAALMATLSALRSGVGLVTVCVPSSLVPAFASRAPEAIWVGLPEARAGTLGAGALGTVMDLMARATALVVGPGLGRDPRALALAHALARASTVPLVIDADALQPGIVRAGKARRILTPHEGEFKRIAEGEGLRRLAATVHGAVIQKAAVTQVCAGGAAYHSFHGGPVLSRGGSGDLLAGLAGGLLAQSPRDPLGAACRATVWHGMAADLMARRRGQTAVEITQWLDCLGPALRQESGPACP